jgi:hypothetical protein
MTPRIGIVGCSATKTPIGPTQRLAAKELYWPSNLFRLSYSLLARDCRKVYILSAHYGLIEDTKLIRTYEASFKSSVKGTHKVITWEEIDEQFRHFGLGKANLLAILGKDYSRVLGKVLAFHPATIEYLYSDLPLGRRMQAIKRELEGSHKPTPAVRTLL